MSLHEAYVVVQIRSTTRYFWSSVDLVMLDKGVDDPSSCQDSVDLPYWYVLAVDNDVVDRFTVVGM